MIPILNASQTREADAYTIANEPIASIDLMERASKAFFLKFLELAPMGQEVMVFAGVGNNGGDALAVARMLIEKGKTVQVFTIGNLEKATEDFKINHSMLCEKVRIDHLENEKDFPDFIEDKIIIDGIFGSGLTRPVTGLFASAIDLINNQESEVFSIDVPSGLFTDSKILEGAVIQADHTITFETPSLSFLQPELAVYVGDWHVVKIGLDSGFLSQIKTGNYLTEAQDIVLPVRHKFSHKGEAGRVLLVTGSRGKMGAATLCARAALRSGVGLLFVHSPVCGLDILQVNAPEAMVEVDEHTEVISEVLQKSDSDVVAMGPGIGTNSLTQKAIKELILSAENPLVIDADAINIIADNPDLLNALPLQSILTPHPGEFKRLVGEWQDDFDKLRKLRSFCVDFRLNVVLKGAHSAVCNSQGVVFFNPTGNPGMATGGSGDVLTGIVAALLGQKLSPFDALRTGVYIHGFAGDLAAKEKGEISLLPSDIVEALPRAFSKYS
jgi:hydroxyethylthiazole kinase-like uncharacterized protein yjeF